LHSAASHLRANNDVARVLIDRYRMANGESQFDLALARPTQGLLALTTLTREPRLSEILAETARVTGGKLKVAGAWMAGNIGWWLGGLALAGLVTERRVLFINPADVHVTYDEGFIERAIVETAGIGVLEGDELEPVATEVFVSVATMRARLSSFLRSSMTPFVEALAIRTRLGKRTLMAQAEASWGSALTHWTKVVNEEWRGHAEVEEFFSINELRPSCPPSTYDLVHGDRTYVGLLRGACCLAYKVDDSYPYCGGCPLISEEERTEKVRKWVEEGLV
jgi:hypothetical protein